MKLRKLVIPLMLLLVAIVPAGVLAQDEGTIIINTNLVNGGTYSGTFDISVTASHPDGIWYITVNIDGSNVKSEYDSTLTYHWDTTMYTDGDHVIHLRSGVNSTFWRNVDYNVHVDNTAPTTTSGPTTTTDSTNTAGNGLLSGDTMLVLAAVGIVGAALIVGYGIKKRSPAPIDKPPDAKVLVICPYCGGKTEQGVTKCQKCGADL